MSQYETMPIEEVKAKIEAGEEIKKVHIGHLALSRKHISEPLRIVDCEIDHLDLNNSTFESEVMLRRSTIGMFVATESIFKEKFDFQGAQIGRGRIQRANFEGEVSGKSARMAHTSFYESEFRSPVDFRLAQFRDGTFSKVTFHDEVCFVDASFENKANFANALFKKKADFRRLVVDDDIDFHHGHFEDELLLFGAVTKLSINLGGATLEGYTDLRDTAVGRSIVLGGVELSEKQGFRFLNSTATSVILEREIVENHIHPEQEGKYRAASREYGFLRTTFENINRFEDEDWAYYQFKKFQRMGKPWSWKPVDLFGRFLSYFFLDLGCGYGTKPFRTLAVCGSLLLWFALFYFLYLPPTSATYGFDSPFINHLFYAFDISLVSFSGSYGDLKITGPIKILAMAEYLLGVVFMGLFIVAFSRKVIR